MGDGPRPVDLGQDIAPDTRSQHASLLDRLSQVTFGDELPQLGWGRSATQSPDRVDGLHPSGLSTSRGRSRAPRPQGHENTGSPGLMRVGC